MTEFDSQATVAYSYSTASSRRVSDETTGAILDRIFIFVVSNSNPSIYYANFVVITNGGGARSLEQPISTNSMPRAFFPRVAIGCRLLGGVLIGGYMR